MIGPLTFEHQVATMSSLDLRTRLHSLIDAVKSEELLQRLDELLSRSNEMESAGVWAGMSEAQRERVMTAYRSSLDASNLIPTAEALKRRKE